MLPVNRTLGVLFAIVGLLQLGWCLLNSFHALSTGHWPIASGVVKTSVVQVTKSGSKTSYWPRISYEYSVDGSTFSNSRIWYFDFADLPDRAKQIVDSHPVGTRVKVYYDATHPDQSLLIPGLSWYSYAWLGLSLSAILIGGWRIAKG